jgi:pSer/pThr/pTyr-binding forkhead associated (FHA) protein
LERLGGAWVVLDEGLSRHGTFVNGERTRGQKRLDHGDVIKIGSTEFRFRAPPRTPDDSTVLPREPPALTKRQRDVLLELCRPFAESHGASLETASNETIAKALYLSPNTVRHHHMKALFRIFGVDGLEHKRMKLLQQAFETGAISYSDYSRE